MAKRSSKSVDVNHQIQHHLERAAVHIQAARTLMPPDSTPHRLTVQIGTRLKQLHRKYGGTQ